MAVFNEDTRVKIPATIQFLRLGYNYQSLRDADIDFNTKVFINRFKPALEQINGRTYTYDEIKMILAEINAMIKNNDLGKEFYNWLINPLDRPKLIDFDDIGNNDFAVVDELPYCVIEGTEEGSFRPDCNILINGMPLAFLEVKKPNNEGGIQKEFDRMINKRLQNPDYRKFFNFIQFVSWSVTKVSDIVDVKDGTHDSPKYISEGKYLVTSKHLTPQGIDFANANHITEKDFEAINQRSKVDTGDILYSMIGAIGTVYKIDEEYINFAIKNVALYKTSQDKDFASYLYVTLKSSIMDNYVVQSMAGSIQKFIGLNTLREMPITYNQEVVSKFASILKPVFDMQTKIKRENQELIALRDFLLPMLMNGQVTFKSGGESQ